MTFVFYVFIDVIALLFMYMASKYGRNHEVGKCKTSSRMTIYKYQLFFFCSFLTLFLVSALRDNVGRDYIGYANAFLRVNNNTLTSSDENWLSIGFRFLSKIVGFFFGKENYIMMFAIISFVTIFFLYKAIYLLSDNWTLSLFILLSICLYYQSFNQLRQIMAVSIAVFGLYYLQRNELRKYILVILIATLIHTSAIVMLILAIVGKWEINKKNMLIYFGVTVALYVGFDIVIMILQYTNYGRTYLEWSLYNTSYESSSILLLMVRLVLMVGCLLFSKETIKRNPKTIVFYNAIIICTVVQLLTIKLYLFARVTWYFYIPYIFLIPEVLQTIHSKFTKRSRKIITLMVYLIFAVYHFVYYFGVSGAEASGYDVYKSLLF